MLLKNIYYGRGHINHDLTDLFYYLFRMGIDDHIALSGLTLKLDSMGGHPENIHRFVNFILSKMTA